MDSQELSIAKLNAMSSVLSAMKDTYYPDRGEKDEIVKLASAIIMKELKNLNPN